MTPAWNALKGLQNKVNIISVHSDAIHNIRSTCAQNINGFPTIMEENLVENLGANILVLVIQTACLNL